MYLCIHNVAPSPIPDDSDSLQYQVTFTPEFTPILYINFTVRKVSCTAYVKTAKVKELTIN